MSRFAEWKTYLRKMKESDQWLAVAGIILLAGTSLFILRGSAEAPTSSSSISSFLLFHLAISLLWIGASALVKNSTTGFEEEHALPDNKPQSAVTEEFYPKDSEQLFERSDSLDSARNNLRTGTGLFLGIGAAISIWLVNTPLSPPIAYLFLLGASLILTFSAVLSILYSFADVTKWYADLSINESLVGFASSDEDYLEQVQSVLLSKAGVLSRMRKSVGVGLLLFIMGAALAMFLPIYQVIPTASDIFWTPERLGTTSFLSALLLCFFLIMFSSMIVGRRYLGILGTEDFD